MVFTIVLVHVCRSTGQACLGVFEKFWNVPFSLSCPPVWTEQLGSHWTDFHEIWCLSIFFQKSVKKIKVSLKSEKNTGYFQWRTCTHSPQVHCVHWLTQQSGWNFVRKMVGFIGSDIVIIFFLFISIWCKKSTLVQLISYQLFNLLLSL
jgi:hypothetical protein